MESSVETTKPTDKPHSKLDVLSGKTRAGTQSPTKVFIRGKRKLKGPLARLNQRQRRTRSEWQTWQGIEVVCRRQIHNKLIIVNHENVGFIMKTDVFKHEQWGVYPTNTRIHLAEETI